MKKALPTLWLALVVLALAFVAWKTADGPPLDTDLMALLPDEQQDAAVGQAKRHVAATLSRRLIVLVGHPDRAVARAQAQALGRTLAAQGLARPADEIPSAQTARGLGAAYFPHRAALLADADRRALLAGDGQALVTRALAQVHAVAAPVDSRLLSQDPLLLFPAFVGALPAPAGRLTLDEGLAGVIENGTTWVMLALTLNGEATALTTQRRVSAVVDDAVAAAPAGTRWLRLGSLFHAHAGAEQGTREAGRIGLLSLAGIVVLMLAVFRSPRPLLLALLAIAVGLVTATALCLALFGTLHVAAQLFGATLIGVAVDYALHYFGQVYTPGLAPARRLERVRTGLILGAATSAAGYALLALSPFPGLRQAALFSCVGLVAALLTVMLWFPLLDRMPHRPPPPRLTALALALYRFWDAASLRRRRRAVLALLVLAVAAGAGLIRADDDIRRQQGLSPVLLAEQEEIQRLTGLGLSGRFFLVAGADEQQVLEREEALAARLGDHVGWQAVARFVPSARRQTENRRLAQDALYTPLLPAYALTLGFDAAPPPPPPRPLSVEDVLATGAVPILAALRVAPGLHVVPLQGDGDPARLAAQASGLDGVRLVDPTADLDALLRAYRLRALALLGVSLAAMIPVLAWRHGWRGALRVAAPPTLAVVATPPLLALAGVDFSFFAAMALILVLSIGVDYAVFCAEDRQRDAVTLLSVALAMLTTLLSFGVLAASDLGAVRAFGATMLVGTTLAFFLAPTAGAWR